jgi:hypothetical protein
MVRALKPRRMTYATYGEMKNAKPERKEIVLDAQRWEDSIKLNPK